MDLQGVYSLKILSGNFNIFLCLILRDINKFSGVIGILYSILGGIAASDTLLLTKAGLDMLLFSIFHSDNQFKGFLSFLLLGLIGLSVFLQVYLELIIQVKLFKSCIGL